MRSVRIALKPPAPLDFALTARVLRRSPRNLIDRVDQDGTWSRAVVLSRGPALLVGKQHAGRLAFEASPAGLEDRRTISALVTRLFSRQQLSLAAGMTRLGRLAERFGARTPDGMRAGPPEPGRVARAPLSALREAGLSARRAAELRELARLPLARFERDLAALSDAHARRRLLELPGIGPWTADYVLLRGLGRLDIFPAGDVGAAHALGRILGRAIEPPAAARFAERFAPLRGMLYFCMLGLAFAAAD